MCGIIAAFNTGKKKKPVNKFITNQYQNQMSRGKEGFGFLSINKDNKIDVVERATEQTKILIDLYLKKSEMIVFHHRWPTSSRNKIEQTHPIRINNKNLKYDYYFIHNGTVRNEDELKEKHEEEYGFKYSTDKSIDNDKKDREYNDSESLGVEVALFIEKKIEELRAKANYAFIMVQISKKTKKVTNIFYGRNNNPLILNRTNNRIELSSEGNGTEIKEGTLYSFNLKDFKTKKRKIIEEKEEYLIPIQDYTVRRGDRENYCNGEYYRRNYSTENHLPEKKETTLFDDKEYEAYAEEKALELTEKIQEKLKFIEEGIENITEDFISQISDVDNIYMYNEDKVIKETLKKFLIELNRAVKISKKTYEKEFMIQLEEEQEMEMEMKQLEEEERKEEEKIKEIEEKEKAEEKEQEEKEREQKKEEQKYKLI